MEKLTGEELDLIQMALLQLIGQKNDALSIILRNGYSPDCQGYKDCKHERDELYEVYKKLKIK